jgi:hypothetical protein
MTKCSEHDTFNIIIRQPYTFCYSGRHLCVVFFWEVLYNAPIKSFPPTKEFLMKRREFLAAGSAGLAALTTATALNAEETPLLAQASRPSPWRMPRAASRPQEFVEVRKYTVKDADKRAKFIEILDKALIPALNRQGLKPAGVFVPRDSEEKYAQNVFVVIPHKTTATFVNVNAKLVADSVYRKDAAPIFETTSKDPVYTDYETFLLHSFPSIPVLEAPQLGPDRVFNLSLYRSFNIERNVAKIKMFDQGGELPLFREVGLNPVFFGNIVAGNRMPALMYMVGTPSLEKHGELWRAFGAHPKWAAMKDLPEYADTATEIDRVVLTPPPGSQI